jgi:hypothetical protein
MAAEQSLDPSPSPAPAAVATALFAYAASRDGRTVVRLLGFRGDDSEVRVEVEIHPVRSPMDGEPRRRSYVFPTPERALKFADETVTAFEYLGCVACDAA